MTNRKKQLQGLIAEVDAASGITTSVRVGIKKHLTALGSTRKKLPKSFRDIITIKNKPITMRFGTRTPDEAVQSQAGMFKPMEVIDGHAGTPKTLDEILSDSERFAADAVDFHDKDYPDKAGLIRQLGVLVSDEIKRARIERNAGYHDRVAARLFTIGRRVLKIEIEESGFEERIKKDAQNRQRGHDWTEETWGTKQEQQLRYRNIQQAIYDYCASNPSHGYTTAQENVADDPETERGLSSIKGHTQKATPYNRAVAKLMREEGLSKKEARAKIADEFIPTVE